MKKKVHFRLVSSVEANPDKKQEFLMDLFNELYTQKIRKEERELEVLLDKFEIHTKGKEILLENAKA